uniref:Uncharacterized protein n=1 Tax=Tanacetum cinerariifolium TaxID=118510 RepID=A0A6L2KDY5_TANCI|nr:hypothetical protein [Tanacetum cinerariifolium]
MLIEQEIEVEEDADEHIEEVTADDDAHGDDSAAHGEVPTFSQEPSIPTLTPPASQPQPPQDRRMIAKMDKDDAVVLMDDKEEDKKVKEAKVDESAQVQERQAESQAEIYKIDMDHANKVLSMQEDETDPAEVQKVVDVVTTTKLITKVVTAASETVTTASAIILTAEPQIPAAILTAAPARVAASSSRRKKGVVIKDLESESATSTIILAETKSKDKGKGILVEEPKHLKKKQQIEQDEKYTRELHAELNKDIDWDKAIDHVKRRAKEDPAVKRYQVLKRNPQTKAQARKNMIMYLKNVDGFEMDYFKGMSYDDIQRAAKRRKLDVEVEDLKRHLEIVPNEDDDVYTEATPLVRKERFSTTKPKNFFDDFLLTTLGAVFETPDAHAQIWKNQKSVHGQAKIKSWKLLESCGVYIITFTTTQLILLVERRKTRQMFNTAGEELNPAKQS